MVSDSSPRGLSFASLLGTDTLLTVDSVSFGMHRVVPHTTLVGWNDVEGISRRVGTAFLPVTTAAVARYERAEVYLRSSFASLW